MKEILDNILGMQQALKESAREYDRRFLEKEIEEGAGNIGELWIEGEDGGRFKLHLTKEGFIDYAPENSKPRHIIRMSVDTFLSLIAMETDFQKEYMRGHIAFTGENYFY
ncbi:MAG: hypothetical protein QMD22_11235, partial [archaeon]|nr:hypothetical protein [archaeon]